MAEGLAGIDHLVVLNLNRREDRLRSFQARARRAGIGEVERVPAVDGTGLSPSPELRELFRGNDFGYRRGVLGCALTHYRLWQRIADPAWPHRLTAVFEDDALFCRDFLAVWSGEVAPWIPDDGELLYLGGLSRPAPMMDLLLDHTHFLGPEDYVADAVNPRFGRPRRIQFCAYSYVLSRSGARTLCRIVARLGIYRAIDWFVIDCWHCLDVYVCVPTLCWSYGDDSDIQEKFETLFPHG
jgi:GR25 family glycosyltransferase involved in LPS biosynthesis